MRHIILLLSAVLLFGSERIVTLSPALSEIVSALGHGDALVGVSRYATYPEAVKALPKVGGYAQPNLEKIMMLKPTLVLMQSYQSSLRDALNHFGISTLSVSLVQLDDIKQAIKTIGQRLNATQRATQLLLAIDKAAKQRHIRKHNPSVLIVFGAKDELRDGIYVAGKRVFFDDIITLCGAHNAFDASLIGQPVLSVEGVIALNPDKVIILYSPLTDPLSPQDAKKLWSDLPIAAAKHDNITVMEASHMHIPSQRVAKTISDLCSVIADE